MKRTILFGAAFVLAVAISARADNAQDNWANLCAKCHGVDGKGQTKMGQRLHARDYTDPAVQAGLKDDEAFKSIKEGLKDNDGKALMKPYDSLSDDEIKALVAYMHTFKK